MIGHILFVLAALGLRRRALREPAPVARPEFIYRGTPVEPAPANGCDRCGKLVDSPWDLWADQGGDHCDACHDLLYDDDSMPRA